MQFKVFLSFVPFDKFQRATLVCLKDGAVPLKKKVPYDQLRPYVTSELHDLNTDDITPPANNTTPPTAGNASKQTDKNFNSKSNSNTKKLQKSKSWL